LGDSPPTVLRCQLLLERVFAQLHSALSRAGPSCKLSGEPLQECRTVCVGSQMHNLTIY
jgi:hypothetical protein